MVIFSWVLAIIIAILLVGSLWVFPNFYFKTTKTWYLRFAIVAWLLITEATQFWEMLSNQGWQHFANYFTLYACTISAWVAIIMLLYPKRIFLDCFFPLGVMGPILTLIFPSKQPTIFEWTYYVFFLGHILTLFGFMYIYLFNFTDYKFSKRAFQFAIITGIIVLALVELFNVYFGTNYIVGDITWALGLKELPRPWQFVVAFFSGLGIILIGLAIPYFFKPIYQYQTNTKLHETWWEILFGKIKTKIKQSNNEVNESNEVS
ncbi:hypothetical protein [Spiroplasma sp. DGKH1]|uniref:TMEM164 family acyltransferase n=1 Tax=Spiroplasma sp. DGKH1 TaxID=3050074 RepID=UPI0034C632CB